MANLKTSQKEKKEQEHREWILPCNALYYDVEGALRKLKKIDWQKQFQMNNAQVGDIVYLYVKEKKSQPGTIRFKGAILEVNKTEDIIDDSEFNMYGMATEAPCFTVAMFREYSRDIDLSYKALAEHGLLSRLQGPTVVKGEALEYIHECDLLQIEKDRISNTIPDTCLADFPIVVNENLGESQGVNAKVNEGKKEVKVNEVIKALDDSHSDEEKEEHARTLSFEDLKRIAEENQKKKPKETVTTTTQHVRDPYVAEYARKRANGICQLCGKPAPFQRSNGEPYLESHHIKWLSKGGEDTIKNTVALCPNCHKRIHVLNDEEDIKKLLEANEKVGLTEEEMNKIVDDVVDEFMEELEAEWDAMDRAEELDEKEIPGVTKIYFDMDSVLADFERGVREICKMEPPIQNGTPDPERDDEMWRRIKEADHFYDRLELMPDAKELFDAVYEKYGDKCEILTGVPKPKRGIVTAGEDKINWVRRLLSKDIKVNIVLREEKKNYCTGKECILIDDMEKNILEWKEMGGSGFMNVTANHTLYRLQELGVV